MRRGRAGPSRPQQHDPVERHAGQAGDEAVAEPGPVGVVPDGPVPVEHDRVDGADRGRVGREVVEVRDHELLAGVGDVHPRPALGPCPAQQVADGLRGKVQLVEIEPRVGAVQAELAGLALVQRRREGRADAGPDQAGQEAVLGHAHGLPRRR
ncbi:hypothetical protein GCM10010472_05840 [Pseudonocardia halophobica]